MKTCNCYEKIRENLTAEGLSISDKCKSFRIVNNHMSGRIGFPLQTTDGKKPKRGKPTFMFLTFCPFCGEKYEQQKETAAT